jgi:hypothetical protein
MTLMKKEHLFANQPESLYALIAFLGIIVTSITINPFTLLLFGKNFSGRNLYFQVLFFIVVTVIFYLIFLFIISKLKKHGLFQALFSKYDIFYVRYKNLLLLFLFLLITTFFIILKMSIFNLDNLRIWKDTTEYVTLGTYPLFSKEFWFGNRTVVLPLLYKILKISLENYRDIDYLYRIAITQVWVSIVAWVTFSAITGQYFKNHFLRIISWMLIYLLSLGLQNSQWEKLILSESLSNSFFILLLALFLLNVFIYKTEKRLIRIIYFIFVFIFSLLYAFTRDTNAYFLLLAGSVILLIWLLWKNKIHIQNYLLIGASFISCFLLAFIDSSLSTRWVIPLVHVLEDRKDNYPVLSQYFYSKGIDLFYIFPNPAEVTKTSISETTELNSKNPEIMANSKAIYTKFLVSHPGYSFLAPLNEIQTIINPYPTDYRYNVNGTPDWVNKLSDSIYPSSYLIYPIGLLLVVSTLVFAPNQNLLLKYLILFLFISIIPIGWLVWHADTLEIPRHSEQIMIQSRIGFWLSILCFLDCVKIRRVKSL